MVGPLISVVLLMSYVTLCKLLLTSEPQDLYPEDEPPFRRQWCGLNPTVHVKLCTVPGLESKGSLRVHLC